jgi:hypothetical protein
MARFKVTLQGIKIDRKATAAETQPMFRRVVRKLSDKTRDLAKATRLFKDRSGRLRAAIHTDAEHPKGEFSVEGGVSAATPYAVFVHQGTKAHRIAARNAPALRFFWTYSVKYPAFTAPEHQPVKFKSVEHPGTRPRMFLTEAAHRAALEDPDLKHE